MLNLRDYRESLLSMLLLLLLLMMMMMTLLNPQRKQHVEAACLSATLDLDGVSKRLGPWDVPKKTRQKVLGRVLPPK